MDACERHLPELLNAGRLSPGGISLPYVFLMSVIKDKNSERVDSLHGMVIALLVDAAIEPINKIPCLNPKRFAYSQKSPYRNWSASFDLLPVACGKSVANHVFLCVTVGLT
jgi:hypothetical protein